MSGFGTEFLGLLKDFLSTESGAYQSFNGSGTRQNLFGAQITNSFGSSITCQMDMVRLWQEMTLTTEQFGSKKIENYAKYESKSLISRILGAVRALESWNLRYFTQDMPGLAIKDTDKAERFAVNWNGYLTIMLGDTAQMNFKGDNLSITRAVNNISYSTDTDKHQQWTSMVDAEMKGFFWYIYALSIFMRNIFDRIVEHYSASMSEAATIIVEIIETIFVFYVPCYQGMMSKRLLFNEKENAGAYIGDDSETAVMQEEFKKNNNILSDLIGQQKARIETLETAKGSLASEISEFKGELEKIKVQTNSYREDLEKSRVDVDGLKKSLEKINADFQDRTKILVEQLEKLKKEMEEGRTGFALALEGFKGEYKTNVAEYNAKMAELKMILDGEMARLEVIQSETSAKIARLKDSFDAEIEKFKKTVVAGSEANLLGQIAAQMQVKATNIYMAIQGYYLCQEDVMIAIQKQKCAKILNSSIERKVVDANVAKLNAQLVFIEMEIKSLERKLSGLAAQENEYIARVQTVPGLDLAATNGDAAMDLNPAAAEAALIINEIKSQISLDQRAFQDAIKARCDKFNAILVNCTKALEDSANRPVMERAVNCGAKRLGEGVDKVQEGMGKFVSLISPKGK